MTLILEKARVRFLQDDMVGFGDHLQYPVHEAIPGGDLFTESVVFGELWVLDLSRRGTLYVGYIKNGRPYVRPAKADPGGSKDDSLLPVGKHKIWLDAWCRRSELSQEYKSDPAAFVTEDGRRWQVPRFKATRARPVPELPPLKYWQKITIVRTPGQQAQEIRIRSRRFHYIYRLTRLIDALDRNLRSYEAMTRDAMRLAQMASVLRNLLGVMYRSSGNAGAWATQGYMDEFTNMARILYQAEESPAQWIAGLDLRNSELLREINHMNNLAELIWRLLNLDHFNRTIGAYDDNLSEDHRVTLTLPPSLFRRLPRGGEMGSTMSGPALELNSRDYLTEFTETFYKPFFSHLARTELGREPAFRPSKQTPDSLMKWMNATRKFGVAFPNYASIVLLQGTISPTVLTSHMEEFCKLLALDTQFDPTNLVGEYDSVMRTLSRNAKEIALGMKARDVAAYREAMRQLGTMASGTKTLPEVEASLEKLNRQIKTEFGEPKKLTDLLGTEHPAAVYLLQSFEILVKGWVAAGAWHTVIKEGGENLGRNMVDATGKTANFASSLLKSKAMADILRSRGTDAAKLTKLGRWGTGLGAAADAASFGVYVWDSWGTGKLEEEVLNYTSSDAYAIESFHVAVAYGKLVTAIGSGGGLTKYTPHGVALQAVGYAFQFTGEFLIELWRIGASEKRYFQDGVKELRHANNQFINSERRKKYDIDFLPARQFEYLKSMESDFKWLSVDAEEWGRYVSSFTTL